MKIKEIAFVCYPVTDVKRARAFYEGVLGLEAKSVFEKDNSNAFIEYWIGENGEHCLVIGAGSPNFKPGKSGPCVALEVDDFDAFVKKVKGSGAPVVMDTYDGPACSMALFADPDGNQLMIHRRKAQKTA